MCCFACPEDAPPVGPLPALKCGHLTFGSVHNLFKLNSKVFDLWARLLRALPGASLLVFRDTLTRTAQQRIRHEFAGRGIDGDRLEMRQERCTAGYLGVYNEIDVSLDTFPVTGGVTTCESLWMGVPVLTLCGERPMARNSASILGRVGLTNWVTHSEKQYIQTAIARSRDLDHLAQLRAGLRELMITGLCDAVRFTTALEDAYHAMWNRYLASSGR
jgi:predicted O-linked N-acetylglucosamine transferase (SPINDLY family)